MHSDSVHLKLELSQVILVHALVPTVLICFGNVCVSHLFLIWDHHGATAVREGEAGTLGVYRVGGYADFVLTVG